MHDVHRVDLLDSCNDLVKEPARFWLLDTTAGDDVVEEFSTTGVLHDEVQLPSCLYDLVELHYVGMSNKFEDVDLPRHSLNIGDLHDALLFQHLDGDSLSSQDVGSKLHLAEGTLANRFAKHIVAN